MNGVLLHKSKEWYQDRLAKIERQSKKETALKTLVDNNVKETTLYNFPKPYDWKKEWKLYRNEVRRITKKQDLQSLEHYEKRITRALLKEHGYRIYRSETYYALDHITSIWYGWKNNISPEIIGHISNLRYIPGLENCVKGIKCS